MTLSENRAPRSKWRKTDDRRRFYHGAVAARAAERGTRRDTAYSPMTGKRLTMTDKPDHQRPEHPDFWNKRFFDEGTTPWNAGSAAAGADRIRRHRMRHAAHADSRLQATLKPPGWQSRAGR